MKGGGWSDIDGGDSVTGMLSNEIRWGSGTETERSGFCFDGNDSINFEIGESFFKGIENDVRKDTDSNLYYCVGCF